MGILSKLNPGQLIILFMDSSIGIFDYTGNNKILYFYSLTFPGFQTFDLTSSIVNQNGAHIWSNCGFMAEKDFIVGMFLVFAMT